jgi:hypothetical protein
MDNDSRLIFEAFKDKGLSDQEYHKARKDAYEGAGEELGHGPIKVELKKNTTIDCYKAGTVQGVRFSKGTIFNCDVNVGDYYECDTEEYGGIAVFPDDVRVLKDGSEDKEEDEEQRDAEVNRNSVQLLKQLKMLTNNALRNVFATIETLDNVDSIPYDAELHSLVVNLDEEVSRLMGILEDEKMPGRGEDEEQKPGLFPTPTPTPPPGTIKKF